MIHTVMTSTVESWYEQTVKLDGSSYVLRFEWSERERRWYMDIETVDGTVLATAIKVCADRNLFAHLTSDLRPMGQLWCVDRTGTGGDPDLRDLGTRVVLYYIDEADLA